MFDFVATHKKLILIVLLVLIIPPFALFGIDSYFTGRDVGQVVARVGDYAVTQDEFTRALRDQQEGIRRMTKGKADPAMLDTPELRKATLEDLVQRRLMLDRAVHSGVTIPDARLKSMIGEMPVFRDASGKFSFQRYQEFLRSEGMTPVMFEQRLRQGLAIQAYSSGYGATSFTPRSVVEQVARLTDQQREVSQFAIEIDRYLGQVKPDPGAAKVYYDSNPEEFRIPEQVRVEYVALSVDMLAKQLQVDPAEVKKYYEATRGQFGAEESRQVSHILITADSAAGAEAKQKAREKAEEIYKQLQKKPAGFAEVAKKLSQDPGSASQGGSLGSISRGTMKDTPEFEAAAFKLKVGEISPPVETRHGYHIIQVTAVQAARTKPFEEVRSQLEEDLKKQMAARRFSELADPFNNIVYEQAESLKPAADLVKAAPQTSGWVTRSHAAEPLLNNPKLLSAVFSSDAIKNRRNTEAVEAAPGTLVAARVVEHKPAAMQPFEEVRAALERKLALREAGRIASTEGRRLLGELKQGKNVAIAWSPPQSVTRADGKDLADPVRRQAFRMDATKLPAYAGVETLQGTYFLVRVSKVLQPEKIPPERVEEFTDELRQVLAQETLAAYVTSLKQKTDVRINKEMLEKKDR
jgi:peptidyl-prolyl cis-trans isomerase D